MFTKKYFRVLSFSIRYYNNNAIHDKEIDVFTTEWKRGYAYNLNIKFHLVERLNRRKSVENRLRRIEKIHRTDYYWITIIGFSCIFSTSSTFKSSFSKDFHSPCFCAILANKVENSKENDQPTTVLVPLLPITCNQNSLPHGSRNLRDLPLRYFGN